MTAFTVRQNIYDDEAFFQGYADLRANPANLNTLVEQPALRALLPPLEGARVLDLGCGFGDLTAYCAEQGAERVLGTDISEKMIRAARDLNAHPCIRYRRAAMEDLAFAPQSFDLVVSSFALHYVRDYAALAANVATWLTPGGAFVFSVEHPIITARKAGQDWARDEAGSKLHWPVDDYGDEGERRSTWFVEGVIKYHRTLATYLNTLARRGLVVAEIREPVASADALRTLPVLATLTRRPSCLIIQAAKPCVTQDVTL